MARLPETHDRNGFYVGYLPLPPAHARFVKRAVPALLAALLTGGALLAVAQRDPGDAVWTTDATRTIEGRLTVDPYPRIETGEGAVLLVESGKFGARNRALPFDGRAVRVTGYPLARDGRTVLELIPGEEAILDVGPGKPPASPLAGQSITLVGEIVDSKCYHGAMKPGDGKTHKACAILCIQGGIPPVLVTPGVNGNVAWLLAAPDGGPVGDWLLPLVGEPVRVTGLVTRAPAGAVLTVSEGDVAIRAAP